MQSVASDDRDLSSVAQALLSTVSELVSDPGKRVYAVMDGAQFDDLPRLLKQLDVFHRPLYRHAGGDYSVVLGGPWLIDPHQATVSQLEAVSIQDMDDADVSEEVLAQRSAALSEQMVSSLSAGDLTGGGMLPFNDEDPLRVISQLRRLVQLSDGKPALVFWCGDSKLNADALYRHLRGLNTICVPKSDRGAAHSRMPGADVQNVAGAAEKDPSLDQSDMRGYERVIFRLADANVMMQVIPVLDETQVATLFGPAEQIIFAPEPVWGGGLKRARKGAVAPPQAVLSLTEENVEAMAKLRLEASRRKRASLFRNSTPHLLEGLNDEEALSCMERYEQQARAHGLRTERGFYQWTYLMSASEGRFIQSSEIRDHLKSGNPDKRLDEVMRLMSNAAIEGVRA